MAGKFSTIPSHTTWESIMNIFIPTRGRVELQRTVQQLLRTRYIRSTALVVDSDEYDKYAARWRDVVEVIALPTGMVGIAAIRQYILEELSLGRHVCMLDDDLAFQYRKASTLKIVNSSVPIIERAFHKMESWLNAGVVHCSMCPRAIAYADERTWLENYRMMHVLCYNTRIVLEEADCSFIRGVDGSIFSMDDFHMTLQLLTKGYGNRVSLKFRTSPSPSNSDGGASVWRSVNTHNYSADALQRIHGADLVRIKEKHGWSGMESGRRDVIISWKKAIALGTHRREDNGLG